MPQNYTGDPRGIKNVWLWTEIVKHSMWWWCCSKELNGLKLPTHNILNHWSIPKNMFPKDGMCMHRNGWMIADLLEDWMNVWKRGSVVQHGPLSKLVLDIFRGPVSDEKKFKLERPNCNFRLISDGMTNHV
jgi:hypothetical protein